MGLVWVAQFVFFPLILLLCNRITAKDQTEMTFLGAYVTNAIALGLGIFCIIQLPEMSELNNMEISLASLGAFSFTIFISVKMVGGLSFIRAFLSAVLYTLFKASFEYAAYKYIVPELSSGLLGI